MATRARGEGKTPVRNLRAEDDLWGSFGAACAAAGIDRSTALRDFMRWYMREPGAKLPKRPDPPPSAGPEQPVTTDEEGQQA